MRIGILALCVVFWSVVDAQAQDPADVVERIEEAYGLLDYEGAELIAVEALSSYTDYTVEQLTEIHIFMALVAYNRGELVRSRRQFLSALHLAPDLQLDPVYVPPKIQEFVEEIRVDLATASGVTQPAARYLLIRDPRTDGALRSMLMPGWGQFYKGHTVKGYAFAGFFGVSAAAAAFAHVRRAEARWAYEDAAGSPGGQDAYDTYRDWSQTRNGFLAAAAFVWAFSYVDALLTSPARTSFGSISMSAQAAPASVAVRVRF